ncbi:septum formation inhibitor Maf [Nonlabens xiamenensis]|uniref:septum formation inhibitor Maf n=1 Tax=Nonlabens xiamenensis TaxID=2341043 RepID=UPI00197D0680|nr:septum formation inhibitor Maf [Nonlabens xiamenensis]
MKYLWLMIILSISSCSTNSSKEDEEPITSTAPSFKDWEDRNLSKEFEDYWYSGTSEISSYELSQARYGELRSGTAVMVFVTEPFDMVQQVKADQEDGNVQSVLKLNATRNFNTGIYPYTLMSSTFYPLEKDQNAIKIAGSIQEWCGHTYMQLNQRDDRYQAVLHSYFQSEGNRNFDIGLTMTENQIPIQLRLGPQNMPVGSFEMIPSVEFLRLKHHEARAYSVNAQLDTLDDEFVYSVKFPALKRTISFRTQKTFPFKILSWKDNYEDGGSPMVSSGTLKKTIKTDYWNKNSNADQILRNSLAL